MINSIKLKNFKSIKEYDFRLRNLNVAMGMNGMGKSTFIQSLLLLRQSNDLKDGALTLNDDFTKIGRGKDAFYQYNKEDEMSFSITFSNELNYNFIFGYLSDADFLTTKNKVDLSSDFFNQSLFTSNFQYLNASRLDPRVIHEKSHSKVINERNIGIHGEYVVHFLNQYGKEDISFDNLIHNKSEKFLIEGVETVDKTLIHQVNNWMGEISPGVKLDTPEIPNSDNIILDFQFKHANAVPTNNFRPTNVGFGLSYALPIVTSLLSAQPGQLIIIENPESHIHPRGQAELGRLISLTAMNDVQVIIETHSDHILNGIRVAVKENQIESNKSVVFYFEKNVSETEQFSKITDIEIDINGELSNYPKNLIDEWTTQLIKLV